MLICDRLKMSDSFIDKLKQKWDEGKFVCVGLDSDYELLPASVKNHSKEESIFKFNKGIIDATADLVLAYKPQVAHYEEAGLGGWSALSQTINYLKEKYPDIPVILDAKRADIDSTNKYYAKAIFDNLGFDAVTVNPYLGKESLEPFLKYVDKGVIILVRTSNPGASEFQDLKVDSSGKPLYQVIAEHIAKEWNTNSNCGVVVGATYPEELKVVRQIIGDMPILIPGVGAQGGSVEDIVKVGLSSKGDGIIISSTRAIIYASKEADFAEAARRETQKLHDQISKAIKNG